MGESFSKKEKSKKKAKQKQDKIAKMKERKANNQKGKSLEDMMAYIDENGNITSTPPATTEKRDFPLEEIQLGATPIVQEDPIREGTVTFYNTSKAYGFIKDKKSGEDVFVHGNDLSSPIKEKDKVSFERQATPRGYKAINVTVI
ncbi:cold-shock protein [Chitinophaga caeni]|uniref:Cold-shock protein n=1 Tax=Chitinophaga caeni TaxID=2029983 RepID=A0A291QXA1_9BACT|nr:cold shock domain-containing protein [Chitinophaga caeni]ATL48541.1 cold-shock protein [Chitinophaga caeni]